MALTPAPITGRFGRITNADEIAAALRASHLAERKSVAQRAHADEHTIRSFDFTEFEFRDEGSAGVVFEGVASVVDTPYMVRDQWGTFEETIRAGAFNKTLKDGKADVALFVNHDTRALPLATRLDGSLVLGANPHLTVRATLNPARPSVQEVRHAVSDGQARQMSIGFSVPKARDQWSEDFSQRTISEVQLSEASIVWRGASPTTSGAMRSFDMFMRSLTDVDMTEAEMRRAVKSMQHRFADVFTEEVETWLEIALKTRFVSANDWSMVDVEDFTDSVVVFCLYGYGPELDGMWQLGYALNADNTVTLDAADPVRVVEVSTYQPLARADVDPAIALRDREDRDRLERKIAARPALSLA